MMVMVGGQIGSKSELDSKGRKIVKKFEATEKDAKAMVKRWNKMLTPGEKKYYRMKYFLVNS